MCCFGQIHSLRMRLRQWNGHDYWRILNDPRKPADPNRRVDVGASSAKPNWSWCSRNWDRAAAVSIFPVGITETVSLTPWHVALGIICKRLKSFFVLLSISLRGIGLEFENSGVEDSFKHVQKRQKCPPLLDTYFFSCNLPAYCFQLLPTAYYSGSFSLMTYLEINQTSKILGYVP